MPSRLIHYLVGNELTKRLEIKDGDRFMAGNLYPDCVEGPGGRSGRKGESHFTPPEKKNKWIWRYYREAFCKKYGNCLKDDELYLGYYCHLLTDIVWREVVIREVREPYRDMEFSVFSKPLYRDYHRLNEILRKEYKMEYKTIPKYPCNIDEVQPELWVEYIQELEEDFCEVTDAKVTDLEILDYGKIRTFVTKAIESCIEEVKWVERTLT